MMCPDAPLGLDPPPPGRRRHVDSLSRRPANADRSIGRREAAPVLPDHITDGDGVLSKALRSAETTRAGDER